MNIIFQGREAAESSNPQPLTTGAPPRNSAVGNGAGAASGRAPGTGMGKGLEEDTERSRSPQSTLEPKGRCHLRAGTVPARSVRHGLSRAAGGWTGSGGGGAPPAQAGLCSGSSAGLRARAPEGQAPREREEKSRPAVPGQGTAHTAPALPGSIAEPSSRRRGGSAGRATRAATSLRVCYSALKCKGSWHDWLSVYKCRWGEGSRFLSPCGFPALKAARAIRGGRKGKEKRISQFQHSSDLPCHCTTRCSVCRTLGARGHANDTGMKEPWQE